MSVLRVVPVSVVELLTAVIKEVTASAVCPVILLPLVAKAGGLVAGDTSTHVDVDEIVCHAYLSKIKCLRVVVPTARKRLARQDTAKLLLHSTYTRLALVFMEVSMRLSGVILDQYDDPTAGVIRQRMQPHEIPYAWKTAALADPSALLDEEYALILSDRGKTFRKYAMDNAVSTAISTFYLTRCGGKLPEEAQKVAAANLRAALVQHGLGVPAAIEKLAGGRRGVVKVANVVDVTGKDAPMQVTRTPYPTNQHMYALSGTKTSAAKYPIDSYDRVQDAIKYFPRHEDEFTLLERREYCTKVASRAMTLGEDVPRKMRVYAQVSEKMSAANLRSGLFWRRKHAGSEQVYGPMLRGIARDARQYHPEMLVGLLAEFDKTAGLVKMWDQPNGVPNPIRSVYKTAECCAPSEDMGDLDVIWEDHGKRLSSRKLSELVRNTDGLRSLRQQFSDSLVDGLVQEPETVFRSLPDEHKLIIARMANDNVDGRDTT